MKFLVLFSVLFLIMPLLWSQEEDKNETIKIVDSLYKEDQFYIGFTYNLIGNKPEELSQSGFSNGFHLGYIKDMPINKRRNKAIGLGIGVSLNTYNHNILINETQANTYSFNTIDDLDVSYSKNKFSTYMVEMPIEFRWRTSTATSYKFWRIYSGFKLSYLFANRIKYVGEPNSIKFNNIEAFNNFEYGISLSVGYNTWNFYFYYALNPIFNSDSQINGSQINANTIKIGLIFYLL